MGIAQRGFVQFSQLVGKWYTIGMKLWPLWVPFPSSSVVSGLFCSSRRRDSPSVA